MYQTIIVSLNGEIGDDFFIHFSLIFLYSANFQQLVKINSHQKSKHFKLFLIKCYKYVVYSHPWLSYLVSFQFFGLLGTFYLKKKAYVVLILKKSNVKSQCHILKIYFSLLAHVAIQGRFWELNLNNHFCGFLCLYSKS